MGWRGRKPFRIPAQAQRGRTHRQRDMCRMQAAAHRWAETRGPHGTNSYTSHSRKRPSGFRNVRWAERALCSHQQRRRGGCVCSELSLQCLTWRSWGGGWGAGRSGQLGPLSSTGGRVAGPSSTEGLWQVWGPGSSPHLAPPPSQVNSHQKRPTCSQCPVCPDEDENSQPGKL